MTMAKPRLIILSGFAAAGKSTIGQLYLKEHPLALFVEGDELIVNLGQWLAHEEKARQLQFGLMKSLAKTHLSSGYDVIWPMLLTNAQHVTEIEAIATQAGADTYEFLLKTPRDIAISRLLERGRWGEAGLDSLTDKDLPEIESLYEKMTNELKHRPVATIIEVHNKSPEETYQEILAYLARSSSNNTASKALL